MATLTSANSVLVLSVAGLYPQGVKLQGYATDDAFGANNVKPTEVVIGVDGLASAAYTPFLVPVEITLQADSPSVGVFDAWVAANQTARDALLATMTVALPSTGTKYSCTGGSLTETSPFPSGKKTLQPRKYEITFGAVTQSPV